MTTAVGLVLGTLRGHPVRLLLSSLVVFVPLIPIRFVLVDARAFPAAIGITFAGHLVLTVIVWASRARVGLRPVPGGAPVVLIGLFLLTAIEIVVGRLSDAVFGSSALAVTLGGSWPSIVVGPAWAVLLAGFVLSRTPERDPGPR